MKYFKVKEVIYEANTKKEVFEGVFKNISGVKMKDIELLKDSNINKNQIINVPKLIRKTYRIKEKILESSFHNEPTRKFSIGDPVVIGRLKNFKVTEIINNGMLYVIENETDFRVVAWHEIYPINSGSAPKSFFAKKRLDINSYQMTVEGLLSKYYHFGVNMKPEYQRGLVWTKDQKIDLIDSIFNYLNIGIFIFARNSFIDNSPGYDIVDGKQRLNTIIEFTEDRFKYNGYYFSDLTFEDKAKFKNITVTAGEISESENNPKNIIEYFVKLNRSGTKVPETFLKKLEKKIYK